jgi:hypothetical protein
LTEDLRAPFPWFGGKRRVADVVWRAFGADVPNYIEPFAGSCAVLLGRPGGAGKIETVNDRDRYLANFFRSLKADPWAVAEWADDPVNEADLHARHKWLVNQAEFRERMHSEPEFYDVRIAGWWVNGLCQWIGGGWCVEPNNHKHPKLDGIGKGVHSNAGHPRSEENDRKRPVLDGTAHARRPHVSGDHAGQGVHRLPEKLPMLAVNGVSTSPGTFLHALSELAVPEAPPCFAWFQALALRLRRVRVACGDWKRVLGDSVLGKGKNVGGRRPCAVFLDPPYAHELRDPYLYSEDDPAVSALVREWALGHGDDPELRIALCGYAGEHEMPATWTEHAWKGARGYAAEDNTNRELERIWFSPHCLPLERKQDPTLW